MQGYRFCELGSRAGRRHAQTCGDNDQQRLPALLLDDFLGCGVEAMETVNDCNLVSRKEALDLSSYLTTKHERRAVFHLWAHP